MVESCRPKTLAEALRLRADGPVIPWAGGTDLMPRHRRGPGLLPKLAAPVLFVAHLDECRGIEAEGDVLRIGAAVTLTELLADERVPGLLRSAAAQMASPAIRNFGTLGGNICNASPAGDTLPPLYVLDATVELHGAGGVREVPLAEFITGPGRTTLRPDELLVALRIGAHAPTTTWYRKVATRKAAALAKVSLAATATVEDGVLRDLRLAVGAAAPTVLRSRDLEQGAVGAARKDIGDRAGIIASGFEELLVPIDDQRSTAEYRQGAALRLIGYFVRDRAWRRDGDRPGGKD